jgi:hypothetical protein
MLEQYENEKTVAWNGVARCRNMRARCQWRHIADRFPGTGSASPSKNNRRTEVTIEDETLKIDLHPDYAEVDVRYRMHNSGARVE